MKLPTVFIASSTEGLEITKAVRALVLQELRDAAKVTPWTREFALRATYIESLEKASQDADFAVLVLTPDDIAISRAKHYDDIAYAIAQSEAYALVCYGHNHAYKVSRVGRTLAVNPGAIMATTRSIRRMCLQPSSFTTLSSRRREDFRLDVQ